ncbi:hypothetical protein [Haloarcula pellucida]|uniref:Uncharacterized protein n=1 Tax=Haloarcula pellucida TaxID=1427151 RepID=A0A830GRW6_9EURY|nr:hypothetical protein [Halomicroarcula pellucida]MBX0350515.1 hypothetical protein [Halomicroarcula pellucida]GGO03687.1 hypothetical protein GCM10009030_39610 [Halomicroarcula pellucida]
MQAGKLGLVTEGWIEDVAGAAYRSAKEDYVDGGMEEIVRMLSVDESSQATLSTIGDVDVYEGAAIWDEKREPEQWFDAGATINKKQVETRVRAGTRWAAVPAENGHDGFAMTATSAGTFAFDQLASHQTVCQIEPAYLDLRSWLEDKRDRLDVWEIGRDQPAGQTTMSWSGREAMTDSQIDEAIDRHAVLTLDVDYDDEYRRVSLAQSGWVEVFEPDMETAEFLEFVSEEVLPYAFVAESDDEAVDNIVHERLDVGDVELTDEDQQTFDNLDTVHMADGGGDGE